MKRSGNNRRAFYVVQFIELPFEGIDDYVCVPYTWMVVRRATDQKAAVAYPKGEDPFNTRDRVKRQERYDDEWRFYMAAVKYESDTYRDAEYWIATRNDYGPSVEKESTMSATPTRLTVNKKLRSANQSNSSKSNNNPRKPLPRISIKRPALSEPKKHFNEKRLKLDEAAQSSSVVVNDANAQPGCLKREEPIIIQDNQSMECNLTEGTAAAASTGESSSSQRTNKSVQESSPTQEQQELNMPLMNDVTPTVVIDDDEKVQPTSVIEHPLFSIQVLSQVAEQPELVQGPNISVAPSMKMTHNDQELHTNDVVNNESTSLPLPNLLKMSANLYSHITGARRLVPIQEPVEKRIRLMNFERNPVLAAQNQSNFMDQTGSLSTHSVDKQSSVVSQNQSLLAHDQYVTRPLQNQYRLTNQDNSEQELLRRPTESNNFKHRPNSRTIRMRTPSNRQNSTHSSNPSYQISELPQQRQSQSNQHDSQRQQQRPKIRVGISITPKNNRQKPTLQGVTKTTPAPILSKVRNSIRQSLSIPHNDYLLNEHQLQASQNESLLVNGNHQNVMNNACQTDECMVEEPLSPYHEETSDSDAVTDHEVISDHEMSSDEAPVETMNNRYCSGIASERSSANRPTATQNLTSPNNQTHPRVVLEQQMLDNFSTLFTQMGSTLRYTCDMYNNLRSSILETADTYRNLLDAVERFNGGRNSTSNASSLSNLTPIVPQATEERHIEVTARAISSHENQHSNNVSDKAPKKKHNNLRRFVLPPEYDPHDTRWTLKYPTNLPGLVELMPQSDIYVSYGELKYCQQVSKDCKSLARRLLPEVFNRKALGVCLSMSEKAQASNNVGSNLRPELDEHASKVLLNFVIDYGLQCGWNTDLKPILKTLHSKVQEIRLRSGVMVKC
uniref:BEN domain-containing protein n=1 Tax=Glyptapanteles indiensis TaxID=92994 RepID=A0JCS8_GLYIN|nr:hypothetical protein GIP_L1_00370 [Glyptapanteles indiensis]